ncbi:hypothetical protein AB0E69_40470 [Kribbella sp. NPDC026611]|uniref:hypothetical protein n=1 Tax=Kribbella sp. NPDC026611 TaxID=3154911 RepID=UPI0034051829
MNPVIGGIDTVATVLALLAALAAAGCVIRDRLPGWPTVFGLLGLEAALLATIVGNVVLLVSTDRDVDTPALIGYLFVLLIIVPAGLLWAFVDRTRFGVATIIVACLAVPVMILRTQQIWGLAHGA